jgi:hypothetical protein
MGSRSSLVLAVLLTGLPAIAQKPAAAPAQALDVRVDPRVELLSIVFRLAGSPEYSQAKVAKYADAVDAHFAPVKDHDVVKRARRLRQSRGVSYDAVAAYAVHLDWKNQLGELVPFEPLPDRLDKRWTSKDARAFLDDLRDFVKAGKVKEFFQAQATMHADAEAAARKMLAENADLSWCERFFGARPGAHFQLALGLLNGGGNYGPSVLKKDGSEELWCILGCWQTDAKGMPAFPADVVPTVVHEFCHSYCNPVVDAHLKELLPAGERMYALVEAPMREQAYGNARTLLCESLVRASVVRYVAATKDQLAVATELVEQEGRSFLWIRGLADALAAYEQQRQEYKTLDAYAPKLAAFFAEAAAKLEADMAKKPHVTGMVPANGQQDVDPRTTAIVVTFDRPMRDQSWAVVGGGEHFPKTGKPSYDQDRKVLTIPVELKPDWQYEFWLNRGKYDSFRSADGESLQPIRVTFRTAK